MIDSEPTLPQAVGALDAGYGRGIYVDRTYAYLAAEGSELRVIDVSNPANPRAIGGFGTSGSAYNIYVVGSQIDIVVGEGGSNILRFIPD